MPKTQQNTEPTEEAYDFSKPDYEFIPKGRHEWRQQGYYIMCKSCEIQHGVWVGPDKLLVGIKENGEPILEKRVDQ